MRGTSGSTPPPPTDEQLTDYETATQDGFVWPITNVPDMVAEIRRLRFNEKRAKQLLEQYIIAHGIDEFLEVTASEATTTIFKEMGFDE